MRYRCALAIGALIVSVWAACDCGQLTATVCTSDAGCPAGQSCVSGQCTSEDGGPGDGGTDGGGPDGGCVNLQCRQVVCSNGGTTSVTGTVYDPSGQLPLFNALVYVPNGQVQAFTPGVSCDRCDAIASGSPLVVALSGVDGTFTLQNVPTGSNIPLVIQLGRWRRQVTLPPVAACTNTPVTDANLLRLPRNQSEGDIPLIAIATGRSDPLECLLRKIGISDSEFTDPSGSGRIHYYVQNGIDLPSPAPAASTLWSTLGTLNQYDLVLLPCESGECDTQTDSVKQNVIDYTSLGGHLFTTHYGYKWIAKAPQPFPSTANWTPDPNRTNTYPPNPFTFTVDQSFPKGSALAQWLVLVQASSTAGSIPIHESHDDVAGTVGATQRWIYGINPNYSPPNSPTVQHLTFNTPVNPPPLPDGGPGLQCGRVVYSDFHVSLPRFPDGGTYVGSCNRLSDLGSFPTACETTPLSPQEKTLVFMLFDASSCVQEDRPTCSTAGQGCSASIPCCAGLYCRGNEFSTCQPTLR